MDPYGVTLELDNFTDGYVDTVDAIMSHGRVAAPREQNTMELLGATLIVPAAAPMLPVGTGRKVSPRLAAVEALQTIGGFSDAAALIAVNPHLADFADGGSFHGAYGPRLRPQIDTVVRRLIADPFTRRAVITLWDPSRDQIEGVKNYPCTTELQFMVRNERVDLHVTMRANDAWHGLAYDAFVFSQLQHTVARVLHRAVGFYVHHAASLHVYEEHWALTENLAYTTDAFDDALLPTGVKSFGRARQIADGSMVQSADDSEQWYIDKAAVPQGVPA